MKTETKKISVVKPVKLDQMPKGPNLGLFFDLKRNKVTKYALAAIVGALAIFTFSLGFNSQIFSPELAKAVVEPVKSVEITAVNIVDLNYSISFTTTNYTNQQGGFHTHFYFNTEANTVVNKMYSGASPYSLPVLSTPLGATEICAIVANANHSIIPDSGNCLSLLPRTGGDSGAPFSNLEIQQVEGGTKISFTTPTAVAITVNYGLVTTNLPLTITETEPTTTHQIILNQTAPCTTYFIGMNFPVPGSNNPIVIPPQQFTTPGCAGTTNTDSIDSDEVISNVRKLIEQLDTNSDGIKLDIPAGAFPENRVLQIKKLSAALNSTGDGVSNSPVLPGRLKPVGKHVYEIKDFIGTSPAPNSTFAQPITFTIDYSPSDIAGLDPNSLTVKSWEGGNTPWLDHTCINDLENLKIDCTTTHFTTFVLAGNPATIICDQTDPCAIFETNISYSPTQALAKRYGGSGSSTAGNLVITLANDARLESTTTCTFRYKFKSDTTWRSLAANVPYNLSTGCSATLTTANQLFWNVDFEITANTGTVDYFLAYSNYDFKAGSIGVTSIGGSGL